MDFSEALKILKLGGRLTRQKWESKDKYIYLVDDSNRVHIDIGIQLLKSSHGYLSGSWEPQNCDLLAEDWIMLP